jgi:hypothetical protein
MSLLEADEHTERKHDPPGGGLWDRLDASRREVIELCGEKGMMLFMFLLESSTILPGQEDIAVCPLRRLQDVAIQLQASPDTVKRYVAVFRALNLVQHYHDHHYDHRREVKLHIPLGPYHSLTNFTALDELIGKRKKQRQLAQKVKNRYITRFGDPTQGYSDEIRTKFEELSTILESEHMDPLKRQRLQMKIADLLTQLVGKSGNSKGDSNGILDDLPAAPSRQGPTMPTHEGDSNGGLEVLCHAKQSEPRKEVLRVGDLKPLEGDLISQSMLPTRQQAHQLGDSDQATGDSTITASSAVMHQSEQQGDLIQQKGDPTLSTPAKPDVLFQQNQKELGDSDQQAEDLILQHSTAPALKDSHLGDSNPQVALKEGDSNPTVVEVHAGVPTYNVNYLISNISNNVKRSGKCEGGKRNGKNEEIAKFLASVLEKHEYEDGKATFSKFLRAFDVYTPEIVGRAFLITMVLLHRKHWKVDKPGALFTKQCKVLSGIHSFVDYTPDEVEEWLRAWGNLPYAELIATLALPVAEPVPSKPAPLVTASSRVSVSSTSGETHGKGLSGHFSSTNTNKKKRTYGLHYTGRPTVLNKGTYNLSGPTPPSGES